MFWVDGLYEHCDRTRIMGLITTEDLVLEI